MLVKTLCTCSCGMVLMMHVRMTQLPNDELVTMRAIKGREGDLSGESLSHNQDT
jgi:hypothetical protein